jgi:hypothetical protein
MTKHLPFLATLGLLVGLSACGGGGDGASVPPPTSLEPPPVSAPLPPQPSATFPIAAAYQAYTQAPGSKSYTVSVRSRNSDGCAGTASFSRSTLQAATFDGMNGYAGTETDTWNFTAGTCTSATSTAVWYYGMSYTPIGVVRSATEFAVYQRPLLALPATAKVGDKGRIATILVYADSTKASLQATEDVTYEINADGTSTAFMDLHSMHVSVSPFILPLYKDVRLRIDIAGNYSVINTYSHVGNREGVLVDFTEIL